MALRQYRRTPSGPDGVLFPTRRSALSGLKTGERPSRNEDAAWRFANPARGPAGAGRSWGGGDGAGIHAET